MAGKGSVPGERRGGRKKGTPNKTTADIKKLAQKYGVSSLKGIAELAKSAENEGTRLAACPGRSRERDNGIGRAGVTLFVTPGGECRSVGAQGPGNAVFSVCGPLVADKALWAFTVQQSAPTSMTAW